MLSRLRSAQQSVSGDDEENDNPADMLQLGLHFCVCGMKIQGVIYSIRSSCINAKKIWSWGHKIETKSRYYNLCQLQSSNESNYFNLMLVEHCFFFWRMA